MAESMMQRMDRNGSGALEREEWADMQDRLGPADANHDGTVTLDEMTAWLATYGRPGNRSEGGGSRDGGPPSTSSNSSSDSGGSAGRKSYRFLSPTERLPGGLPDWFAQKDADGDGQVMMSEYTTVWTQSKVDEFSKYDLNADGIITPQECLKASR
jgi:Ca2+-binding EF-hand superfamily protein